MGISEGLVEWHNWSERFYLLVGETGEMLRPHKPLLRPHHFLLWPHKPRIIITSKQNYVLKISKAISQISNIELRCSKTS